jgi:hypothetical protein
MPQHLTAVVVTVLLANKHLLLRTKEAARLRPPWPPPAQGQARYLAKPGGSLSCRSRHWVQLKPLVEGVAGVQHATHPDHQLKVKRDSKIVNSPDLKLKVQVQVVTLGNFALGQPPKTMRIGS